MKCILENISSYTSDFLCTIYNLANYEIVTHDVEIITSMNDGNYNVFEKGFYKILVRFLNIFLFSHESE